MGIPIQSCLASRPVVLAGARPLTVNHVHRCSYNDRDHIGEHSCGSCGRPFTIPATREQPAVEAPLPDPTRTDLVALHQRAAAEQPPRRYRHARRMPLGLFLRRRPDPLRAAVEALEREVRRLDDRVGTLTSDTNLMGAQLHALRAKVRNMESGRGV